MHDVDDVAVGDVAGLGALERAALLIEQQAQLDEQRGVRRQVEQPHLGRRASRAVTVPDADVATTPSRLQRGVQRTRASRSASSTAACSATHGGILEGDRHAVGQADPLHAHDVRIRRARPRSATSSGAGRRHARRDHVASWRPCPATPSPR